MFAVCDFDSQYLGNYTSFEEYNKRELACDTTICLLDSQRLLLAATHNRTIKPCDDFREFAVGRFIKLGALDDRKESIGFYNDVLAQYYERIRKVLAAIIDESDIRPLKIAKNFSRKCVNSGEI